MFGMDMRSITLAALSLLVALGVFQLGTMTSVAMIGAQSSLHAQAMQDCPMGSVCPAQYESAQLLGSISTPASLGLLIAFTAAFAIALPLLFRRVYAAPLLVFTDSGPPALRSVFKKE